MKNILHTLLAASFALPFVFAQTNIASASCSPTLTANHTAPTVASGFVARLVATHLASPRGIKFDSEGHLLVIESGTGMTALTLKDSGNGCISESSRKTVVLNNQLNHGIELSNDGKTLYASSSESVFSWDYSPGSQTTGSNRKTLVTNMTNTDHTTRTLMLSKFAPDLMVVCRGSTANIDPIAENIDSGHSEIKAFNLTNMTSSPYKFDSDGWLLGWGLRNDVGIDEHPVTGGLYSVENSVDQMHRNGVDIHDTNPAEELNFLGYLNGTKSSNQGRNFGYPECYTAWNVSTIPQFNGKTGQQFAIGDLSKTNTDAKCSEAHKQKARLPFHPHMAPLDILFNDAGTSAWITFHGSWDSDPPVGYKLTYVQFDESIGEPIEPATSKIAAIDVLGAEDINTCPFGCVRPVGLAWDSKGRLFMSSDTTGEIYAILRADGKSTNSFTNSTGMSSGTSSGQGSTGTGTGSSSSSTSGASIAEIGLGVVVMAVLAMLL